MIRTRLGLAICLILEFYTVTFAAGPSRIIAIMENERLLEAEPNIKLVDFFQSQDPAIRARAVLAAARIGNGDVLPAMRPLLTDQDPEVRRLVSFALGQIRSKEGLAMAAVLLKDEDLETRRLALEATGRIGGIEVTGWIVPFLDDSQLEMREQAALSLALIKDQGTVEELIPKVRSEDPAQWSYVYALYRLADIRALDVLHQVLNKPVTSPSTGDPSSMLFALKALWSMKKPLTLDEIKLLLNHQDPRVQTNALDVLIAVPDKEACGVILEKFKSMPFPIKVKAVEASAECGCFQMEFLQNENPNVRGAALKAYTKLHKDEGLPLLQVASEQQDWILRWYAAQAASGLTPDMAIPLLKKLSKDSNTAVKLAALDSLTTFLPRTADSFVPLLKSPDFAERATVADALGKTKDPTFLPMLLQTYRASSDATEIEGRVAVLDVLADYNDSEVLKIYEEALLDPEYTIRSHAIDGIKKLVGSGLYWDNKVNHPDDFLFSKAKVTTAIAAKYPLNYGEPVPDYLAEIMLERGKVVVRLFGTEAPVHVLNFKKLADKQVYNGLRIHRVVPNFVIQGGDPRGDGWGGAGEVIHDQMNSKVYMRGMMGMPIAGKDTGGSQFFITLSRQPHLDGNYTIFGEVISGMEFVDSTMIGDRILKVQIKPASNP
jgi:cyclophilin family peptidyl-prolyl cis-trans isomerase/HEAT repeat protein